MIGSLCAWPITAEYAWFSLNIMGELPIFDRIHPQNNKFVTCVENKATDNFKPA